MSATARHLLQLHEEYHDALAPTEFGTATRSPDDIATEYADTLRRFIETEV